jgi:hypothetical protein
MEISLPALSIHVWNASTGQVSPQRIATRDALEQEPLPRALHQMLFQQRNQGVMYRHRFCLPVFGNRGANNHSPLSVLGNQISDEQICQFIATDSRVKREGINQLPRTS